MLQGGKYKDLFKKSIRMIGLNLGAEKFDYTKTTNGYFAPEDSWENVYPTILPQWDRTARVGKADGVYVNSTPEKFQKHIEKAISIVKNKQPEHRILFLKSWNEWAEGNYVEPDLKYGKGYIEALLSKFKK